MDEKTLLKKIDTYTQSVIDLQTNMIACPAVAPASGGTGEGEKATYLLSVVKKMKFDEVVVINVPDANAPTGVRPNILAKYYGQNKNKTLWVMAHMDVVPAGDLSLWNSDPFKAVVKGDKIYGRGAEDNQQGIVSGLVAVKAMMDLNVRPPCNYALLFNADEEMGSEFGLLAILKKHAHLFGPEDVFLVPDGGLPDGTMVEVAEKNMLWAKITVTGKPTHASTPMSGSNANRAAAYLTVALDQRLHKKFNKKDKLFAPEVRSTFEPTKREANVPNVNTIPGREVFYMDCRILPRYDNAKVLAEMNKVARKIEKKFNVTVTIEDPINDASKSTDPKHPVVLLTKEAVQAVYKNNPRIMGVGGGTVGAYLRNAGFPAVVYARLDETMHQPNEYSSIKNALGDAKVFALVAMRFN